MQKHYTAARARVRGGKAFPDINGIVTFRQTPRGVLVTANICGLPADRGIYAFHIHSGTSCTGNVEDEFADAKMHYNPDNSFHPYHAGDLPPLFSNDGCAYAQVLTNRFAVKDVIGRTVIIHDSVDDFTTQPSGNSGEKIACGIIVKN